MSLQKSAVACTDIRITATCEIKVNLLYDPKLCKFQSMVIYILSIETCIFYLKLTSHGNVLHSAYACTVCRSCIGSRDPYCVWDTMQAEKMYDFHTLGSWRTNGICACIVSKVIIPSM